jgi:hypothetical protein
MSATVVDIYIPEAGKPKVQFDFVTASGGAPVIWQVFNQNALVEKVEIAFEGLKYFGVGSGGFRIVRPVPPHTCGVIHGIVPLTPDLEGGTSRVRRDKYAIRGLRGSEEPVKGVELDPEIVVKEP